MNFANKRIIDKNDNLLLIKCQERGKCVIAMRDFKAGEIIMKSPVIVFNNWHDMEKTELKDYYFNYQPESDLCCIATSILSFLNHSSDPNADRVFDYDNELMICKASKDIRKGEEIVWNYKSVWFDELAPIKMEESELLA